MKNQWRLVVGIILVLIVALFAILNVSEVPVNFGFTKVEWPLIMVILGSLFVGAIAAVLVSTGSSMQLKKQVKQQGKELTTFDQKVAERTESLKAEYENKLAEKEIALVENKKKMDSLEQELVTKLTTPPTEKTL